MSNFKPQVRYVTNDSKRNYYNGIGNSMCIFETFKTYRELRGKLVDILKNNIDDYVSVSRSKRGEWGEYYEHWILSNGKPKIIKQGWM